MTNHPSSRTSTANANNDETTLAHRVAALELMLQQLLFVLDARGALTVEELGQWLDTAAGRMGATGSVPPGPLAALRKLTEQVCE